MVTKYAITKLYRCQNHRVCMRTAELHTSILVLNYNNTASFVDLQQTLSLFYDWDMRLYFMRAAFMVAKLMFGRFHGLIEYTPQLLGRVESFHVSLPFLVSSSIFSLCSVEFLHFFICQHFIPSVSIVI